MTATTHAMNSAEYAEKIRLRDDCEKFKRAFLDEREKFASYRRAHPEGKESKMTGPTEYHVTHTPAGEVAITIGEDAHLIAIGAQDLLTLARMCDLAINETGRLADVARVSREMECEQRCMETLRKVGEVFGPKVGS